MAGSNLDTGQCQLPILADITCSAPTLPSSHHLWITYAAGLMIKHVWGTRLTHLQPIRLLCE
jgi:hypothetical protein